MKAMWSAASGMKSLQFQIDTISNNLANVNTAGFKSQRVEFKDLIYEKITDSDVVEGEGRPVPIEIGHGVMTAATVRSFSRGSFQQTENELDLAINGDGFFVIRDENEELYYSKDGNFNLSVSNGSTKIVTADGKFLQGDGGDIDLGADVTKIQIDSTGNIQVQRNGENDFEDIAKISIAGFANPEGLESVGKNLYEETSASGIADIAEGTESGEIWQGFIEASNVEVVDEMINMITAQRAYELNSKTITTADRMLEIANNLKR